MKEQLKSLSKGLQVYKEIIDYGKPIVASTLCKRLELNKSTMSRILQTLNEEGFITYIEKTNEIIANNLNESTNKKTKIELIIKATKPLLEEIHKKTKECAYLGIFSNYKVLYINQIDYALRKLKTRNNIGIELPIYNSALGKSILAFGNYDLEKLRLNQYTYQTITDIKKLEKTLEEVKQTGYSLDISEHQDNMRCVAVPLFNNENILIGAVGISGTKNRLNKEKLNKLGKLLQEITAKYQVVC